MPEIRMPVAPLELQEYLLAQTLATCANAHNRVGKQYPDRPVG